MTFILGNWVNHYTKEFLDTLKIVLIGFLIITIATVIKYKPAYEVTLAGKTIGYISDKEEIEQEIHLFMNDKTGNIAFRVAANLPEYKFIFVSRDRDIKGSKQQVLFAVESSVQTIYKTYAITLDGEKKAEVSSEEEAMQVINDIKEGAPEEIEMVLGIESIYSTDLNIETKEKVESELNEIKSEKVIAYEIKKNAMEEPYASTLQFASTGEISGIPIIIPVNGNISSRFGERSSRRSSLHTGLDIATSAGTEIKPIADGIVTYASYNGAYGNLVKIEHGNGVESWYAHCSSIYVKVGQEVDTFFTIARVGSTGNSTGPHLHLEIRINGAAVNPQNYLYN